MQKNEIGTLSYTTHKNQLKVTDLNIRLETIKLLGKKTLYIGVGKNFLKMTPKAQKHKRKIQQV